jgi:hypothetical protein
MRGTCAQTAIVVAVLLAQCQQTGCSNDARRRAPAVPVSVQDRIKRKTRQWQPGTREGGVGVGGEGADEQPVAQRPATDQDGDGSWRNKAAERLGLARGAGQERSSETKAGTAEAANNALQCNVTLACHACPEASIRDRAEYCLPTRWRQQVRCLRLGVEVEVRFESCKNCTTLRCVANRVCAACSRCSLRSYACMPVSHGVHVGLPLIDPNRRLSPSGCFLTHTYTHTLTAPHTLTNNKHTAFMARRRGHGRHSGIRAHSCAADGGLLGARVRGELDVAATKAPASCARVCESRLQRRQEGLVRCHGSCTHYAIVLYALRLSESPGRRWWRRRV